VHTLSYVDTVYEINDESIRNEGLDILYPLYVCRVGLQVISPVLFVVELADVSVCEAALDKRRVSSALIPIFNPRLRQILLATIARLLERTYSSALGAVVDASYPVPHVCLLGHRVQKLRFQRHHTLGCL
jgi:hypothetical protein